MRLLLLLLGGFGGRAGWHDHIADADEDGRRLFRRFGRGLGRIRRRLAGHGEHEHLEIGDGGRRFGLENGRRVALSHGVHGRRQGSDLGTTRIGNAAGFVGETVFSGCRWGKWRGEVKRNKNALWAKR